MATQTWESCIYTADEERDFLKNNLGPTFHKNGFQDKKIIVWDHNRDLIYQRASTILNDPEAIHPEPAWLFHIARGSSRSKWIPASLDPPQPPDQTFLQAVAH